MGCLQSLGSYLRIKRSDATSPLFLIKFLELILALALVIVQSRTDYVITNSQQHSLMYSTFGSYCIITPGVILGFVLDYRIPKRVELLYQFTGGVLFLASGMTAVTALANINPGPHENSELSNLCATIILATFTGAVYLLDVWFTASKKAETPA